jgi:hypothetical protein
LSPFSPRIDPAQGKRGAGASPFPAMISLEDCIAFCGLTEAEVAAIAEHEHVPEVAAAMLGQYLLHQKTGLAQIREMIVDDIRFALKDGNKPHAAHLLAALRHLMAMEPAPVKGPPG